MHLLRGHVLHFQLLPELLDILILHLCCLLLQCCLIKLCSACNVILFLWRALVFGSAALILNVTEQFISREIIYLLLRQLGTVLSFLFVRFLMLTHLLLMLHLLLVYVLVGFIIDSGATKIVIINIIIIIGPLRHLLNGPNIGLVRVRSRALCFLTTVLNITIPRLGRLRRLNLIVHGLSGGSLASLHALAGGTGEMAEHCHLLFDLLLSLPLLLLELFLLFGIEHVEIEEVGLEVGV